MSSRFINHPLFAKLKPDDFLRQENGNLEYLECFVLREKVCPCCGCRAEVVLDDECCIEIDCCECTSRSTLFKDEFLSKAKCSGA